MWEGKHVTRSFKKQNITAHRLGRIENKRGMILKLYGVSHFLLACAIGVRQAVYHIKCALRSLLISELLFFYAHYSPKWI